MPKFLSKIKNAGNTCLRGWVSTIDLLVIPCLLELLLNIANIFYKTSYLNQEVNCTEPSPSVRGPCKKVILRDCPRYKAAADDRMAEEDGSGRVHDLDRKF